MERMEVDQCAGAAGGAGGGALRRSNSAPMITSVSDGMTVFSPMCSARYRRSSVSINPSCPSQLVPLSPFSLTPDRLDQKRQCSNSSDRLQIRGFRLGRPQVIMEVNISCLCSRQEENMEMMLRGSLQKLSASSLIPVPPVSQWHDHTSVWFQSQDSGVTPNSSPSPTRRFRPAVSAAVRWPALTPLKRKGGMESDGPPKKLFVAGVTDPSNRSSYTVSVSQAATDSPPTGDVVPQSSPLSLSPPPSFTPFTSHQHPGH
uniref:P2R1A-PPP2R2A-interacting phosphatase regulator 1 isoform X1 n=1 Tax=Scatophagus argus TaxID=75038 RepID=UPI001ED8512D|nr:P2R1A-PPP2R2A-interacting phosphatase regulator 1 isoform X1 [Scatophagus argus]